MSPPSSPPPAFGATGASVPSILLVDDEPSMVQALSRMLAPLGRCRFALDATEALAMALQAPPDLIFVDAEMPGMNGFEFCARARADPVLAGVPVIFVTGHTDDDTEVACFAAGAADFIRKPPNAPVVLARARTQMRLKTMSDALRAAAEVDGLTNIANRRHFDTVARMECDRARRSGLPLSLLMIDVDHFKRYNDRYGHPAGDRCLQGVARALRGAARRPADLAARYGGEEFVLLMPDTDLAGAEQRAQAVVAAIAALQEPHEGSMPAGIVTVSVGVATALPDASATHAAMSIDALVSTADRALYAAKVEGRNRWHSHPPLPLSRPAEVAAAAPAPDAPGART